MNRLSYWLPAAALVAALAAALWYWWPHPPTPPATSEAPAPATEPAAPSAVATAASQAAIRYPIEAASAAEAPKTDDLKAALEQLLGAKAVLSFLLVDDFPQRFVTTVDNLGRPYASSRLWPVNPTPGRFTISDSGGGTVVAADNAQRYAAFVNFADSVEAPRAVAVYRHLYPQFQRAYEDLGYPGHYFNDRLVEVLDQLLDTPEPEGPLAVHLTQVKGPVAPERPWILYEFDDPTLQSLSAGQKILLRMGPEHERRLKAKLREFRHLLAGGAAGR